MYDSDQEESELLLLADQEEAEPLLLEDQEEAEPLDTVIWKNKKRRP
jgi:hypothetical protein